MAFTEAPAATIKPLSDEQKTVLLAIVNIAERTVLYTKLTGDLAHNVPVICQECGDVTTWGNCHSFILSHAQAGFPAFRANYWAGENVIGCSHDHAVAALHRLIQEYHVPLAQNMREQAQAPARDPIPDRIVLDITPGEIP